MKEGNGSIEYPDGSKYTGSWLRDKKHGFGKYYYSSGATYEGEFIDDLKSGFGFIEKGNNLFQINRIMRDNGQRICFMVLGN